MRKLFFVSLFLIFSFFCFADAQILLSNESVQTNLRSWDFGKVKVGQILKHTFVYKNESEVVVELISTNTSCGCTVSAIKNKKLLPGDSSDIDVTFNSKGYNGQVKQFVYLNTDNLADPIVRFEINAEVEK